MATLTHIIPLVCAACLITAGTACGVTRYVAPDGAHVAPFSDWGTAATTIQAAVNVCVDGDSVVVTNGIYTGAGGALLGTNVVVVTSAITVRSANGNDGGTVIDGSGTRRGVYLGAGAVLEGFTVRNGYAFRQDGAGVYCAGATVRKCTLAGNRQKWSSGPSYYGGGGICVMSNGWVADCIVTGNLVEAQGDGGGIWLAYGGVASNCVLARNSAGYGGGIALYLAPSATVANCVLEGNVASMSGGGALVFAAGVLSNCTVRGNSADTGGGGVALQFGGAVQQCAIVGNTCVSRTGGGIYIYMNGTADRCVIMSNATPRTTLYGGGGAHLDGGGMLRNSLLAYNRAAFQGGGAVMRHGLIENCTITANASPSGAGLFCTLTSVVNNTIIAANDGQSVSNTSAAWFTNCCAETLLPGVANVTNAPGFLAAAAGDFRLATNAACRDAAAPYAWMTIATDLAGTARIVGPAPDIGCYELGPLVCSFTAVPAHGLAPLTVEFAAQVAGTNVNGLVYAWDWDGDGVADLADSSLARTQHVYSNEGRFVPALTVSNAGGAAAYWPAAAPVLVFATNVHYVATTGSNVFPYTSWATAAHTLDAAVDAALDGHCVLVTDGVYHLEHDVIIRRALTLASVSGRDHTLLVGTGGRCLQIEDVPARVIGLTLSNGTALADVINPNGGGVMAAGQASIINCTVIGCRAFDGGGIMLAGGVVSNTLVMNNVAQHSGGGVYAGGTALLQDNCVVSNHALAWGGGGIYATDTAVVRRCIVARNSSALNGGGVQCAVAARVQDTLMHDNYADNFGGGAMLFQGGIASGCVFSNNTADARGGGVCSYYLGVVSNCLAVNNTAFNGGGIDVNGNGGIYVPRVATCVIRGNTATYGGGVFVDDSGLLRSCVVADNTAEYGGGVYLAYGGVAENLTVCHNNARVNYGGLRLLFGAAVSNTISYYNTGGDIAATNAAVAYCCGADAVGVGSVTTAPAFVSAAQHDYRLDETSPCVNAGKTLPWMATAVDLAGTTRVLYTTVDVGAYEMPLGLWCSFAASQTQVMPDTAVTFTASVAGSNATAIVYAWDFDGQGQAETQTYHNVVAWRYATEGIYSVALTVSNALTMTRTCLRGGYITVVPEPAGLLWLVPLTFAFRSCYNVHNDNHRIRT